MSHTVVVFFLLDNLPGFDIALNKTLGISRTNTISSISTCDTSLTDPIMDLISRDLQLKVLANWRNAKEHNYISDIKEQSDIFKELSSESLYNISTVFDNSLVSVDDIISSEKFPNFIDSNYLNSWDDNLEIINKNNDSKKYSETTETGGFPISAPFLVAIFETLSNVTAQTCDGILISPQWVLTAGHCINLLADLYNNSIKEESRYTAIVGAENPLIDGSAHRVTKIIMRPTSQQEIIQMQNATSPSDGRLQSGNVTQNLALMMIDPIVKNISLSMKILEKTPNEGAVVRIYGWILKKNESDIESMRAVSFPAIIMNNNKCGFINNSTNIKEYDIICLSLKNETTSDFIQLNTGGPILVVYNHQAYLLALIQAVEHSPFFAYTLSNHVKWIKNITN